jgi:hypothetical protein
MNPTIFCCKGTEFTSSTDVISTGIVTVALTEPVADVDKEKALSTSVQELV